MADTPRANTPRAKQSTFPESKARAIQGRQYKTLLCTYQSRPVQIRDGSSTLPVDHSSKVQVLQVEQSSKVQVPQASKVQAWTGK